jgi:hypothetical protein
VATRRKAEKLKQSEVRGKPDRDIAYAVESTKNGHDGFIFVVQAVIGALREMICAPEDIVYGIDDARSGDESSARSQTR